MLTTVRLLYLYTSKSLYNLGGLECVLLGDVVATTVHVKKSQYSVQEPSKVMLGRLGLGVCQYYHR